MRYLVVLDSRTTMGRHFLADKNNDGMAGDADSKQPALDCPKVDPSNFHYLIVTREIRHGGGTQELYIPHSAVAYVVCYEDKGPKPMGFLPR
jgi:hypothetical protein